jgi:hypothetical protein
MIGNRYFKKLLMSLIKLNKYIVEIIVSVIIKMLIKIPKIKSILKLHYPLNITNIMGKVWRNGPKGNKKNSAVFIQLLMIKLVTLNVIN